MARPGPVAPAPVKASRLVYDAGRGMVVFMDASLGELWDWDGVARTWSSRTIIPRPLEWPYPDHGEGTLVYNPAQGELLLYAAAIRNPQVGFGGHGTWVWDGRSGQWRHRGWSDQRLNRSPHLVFDVVRRRVLLFSSEARPDGAASAVFVRAWDAGAGAWRDLPAGANAPGPSSEWLQVPPFYDSRRQAVVLIGPDGSVWEWREGA